MSSSFIGRLAALAMILLQSPFMASKTGSNAAPITLITKFIVSAVKKEGIELSDQAKSGLRALNFPAHMFEECVIRRIAKLESNCDATFVWERAISHASKGVSFWDSLPEQNRQVLFGGCVTTAFGAVISFLSGRTHLLAVLGNLILGYGIFTNGLMPTVQFILCFLIAIFGLRARTRVVLPPPQPVAPPAKAAATAKKVK